MNNRSRIAAKATGVLAIGALVFGVVGAAGAATNEVSYKLDSGSVTIGTGAPFALNPSTGVTGTYDDVTGAFTGTFTSAPSAFTISSPAEVSPGVFVPANISVQVTNIPLGPVTGTIDPTTGLGTIALGLNVQIFLESVTLNPDTAPAVIPLGSTCNVNPVNITFNAVATGMGAGSVTATNIALDASGFTVPAATCAGGNADLLPQVTAGLNKAFGIVPPATSTTQTAAALALSAGAIPPPAPTTTTTIATTTTTEAPAEDEAGAAAAVTTNATFTG